MCTINTVNHVSTKELIEMDNCHHSTNVTTRMKMKMKNPVPNDNQNIDVMDKHLNKSTKVANQDTDLQYN